jgi:hypothetical protein
LPDRATRVRRRRLALVLVVALAALMSIGLLRMTQGNAVGTDGSPHPIPRSAYIVQPGDTFWTIAERVAPNKDPRPIVDELQRRHGGGDLQVGDHLDLADLT